MADQENSPNQQPSSPNEEPENNSASPDVSYINLIFHLYLPPEDLPPDSGENLPSNTSSPENASNLRFPSTFNVSSSNNSNSNAASNPFTTESSPTTPSLTSRAPQLFISLFREFRDSLLRNSDHDNDPPAESPVTSSFAPTLPPESTDILSDNSDPSSDPSSQQRPGGGRGNGGRGDRRRMFFLNSFVPLFILFNRHNDFHLQGQPPASEKARSELRVIVPTTDQLAKDSRCTICLEDFDLNDSLVIRQMPCIHFFHEDCLFKWLQCSNTCPTCRYPLDTDNVDYNRVVSQLLSQRRQSSGDSDEQQESLKRKRDSEEQEKETKKRNKMEETVKLTTEDSKESKEAALPGSSSSTSS